MDQRAIDLHNQALSLMPEESSHDESECPICIEVARQQSGDKASESVSMTEPLEGTMSASSTDTLSQETHKALLRTAVEDATAALRQENEDLTSKVESLTSERDEAKEKVSTLEGEVARLNTELDTAQVASSSATERVEELEAEIAERDEADQRREVASERAKQVRNLGLFEEEAIEDKAERWASLSEEDWAERIEEWKSIHSTNEGAGETGNRQVETASAMSGTSEGGDETASKKTSARRAVLGLPAKTA